MDQIVETKKQCTAASWQQRIIACRNSGIPVTQWCSENGIGIKAYYYWLRKLRVLELEKTGSLVPREEQEPTSFKKLEVITPSNVQAAVIIHLGPATVEVQNGVTQQTVEAVLLALKSIC